MCFGRLNSESLPLVKNTTMRSCDIKIRLRLSFFSRRKNLPVDVHLHNGRTDVYLLFIAYHVAKDTSRSMNSEGTKKCFTIWKLLIIIQETLTIFGCEEVLEFLQWVDVIMTQGKFPLRSFLKLLFCWGKPPACRYLLMTAPTCLIWEAALFGGSRLLIVVLTLWRQKTA